MQHCRKNAHGANGGYQYSKTGLRFISMQQGVTGAEPFDINELSGTDYTDNMPLVQPEAITDDAYPNVDLSLN